MNEIPRYVVLVIFGREHNRSVASPDLFLQVIKSLALFLETGERALQCRGRIETPSRHNAAPRKQLLSPRSLGSWIDALHLGDFRYIELFDTAISQDSYPTVYASVHKLGPSEYTHETSVGAENCIIVAVSRDLISLEVQSLEDLAKEEVDAISGFYGSLENNVPWGEPRSNGRYMTNLIDMRWSERTRGDYVNGIYKMKDMIPRLYWGNLLSEQHFKHGNPYKLPLWSLDRLEEWDPGLFYVRFVEDPQLNTRFYQSLTPYFNLIETG